MEMGYAGSGYEDLNLGMEPRFNRTPTWDNLGFSVERHEGLFYLMRGGCYTCHKSCWGISIFGARHPHYLHSFGSDFM